MGEGKTIEEGFYISFVVGDSCLVLMRPCEGRRGSSRMEQAIKTFLEFRRPLLHCVFVVGNGGQDSSLSFTDKGENL